MRKSIVILALALEFALAATATAATVKGRTDQARAQAGEAGVSASPDRVRALHECNARIERFKGYYQMNTPTSIYRSCMHEHGQPE
jgi:hypothetical protein